ncbi:MAG TPA: hypothetical protein VMW41_00730 [Candidatus Bathyarchaeia archaeon]|nr:hypothetical protein [Candidatus Bathyarchaeia archaeon]
MNRYQIEIGKIVGTSTGFSWSQVHSFLPDEEIKIKKRGQLLAAISLGKKITGDNRDKEMVLYGREIIARLHEEYYGEVEDGILEHLKKSVLKVAREITDGFTVEIAVAVFWEELVYLVIYGAGKAMLGRGDLLSVVCRGRSGELNSSSGYLQEGDFLLLASSDFWLNVAEGVIKAALSGSGVEEVAESLAPIVYGKKDSSAAVGVIAQIKLTTNEASDHFKEPFLTGQKSPVIDKKETEKPSSKPKKLTALANLKTKLVISVKTVRALFSKRIRGGQIYLGRISPEERKKRSLPFLRIGVISILLLAASIVFGVRQKRTLQHKTEIRTLLAEIESKINEGKNLVELNPIRSRQLLSEAWELAGGFKPEEKDNQTISGLKKQIEETMKLLLREYNLADLPLFFDLEIVKEGGMGKELALLGDNLIVLDENKAVYGIGTENKKGKILAGGDSFEGASQLAVSDDKIFVLTKKGIIEQVINDDQPRVIVEWDQTWGEVVDLRAYFGNLYLLDSKNAGLFRYPVIEGGFGAKQSWAKGNQDDLAGSVSMSINGSVWIYKQGGKILKFTQGFTDPFGIAGLDKPFSSIGRIYTDMDQENLYILDQDNRRIVVLSKNGEYRCQYIWSSQMLIDDFVVSEKMSKVWLLGGSKIYEIKIKQ